MRWELHQWQFVMRNHWDNLCSSGSYQFIFGQEFSQLVRTTSAWVFRLTDMYIIPAQTLSIRGFILSLASEIRRFKVWICSHCNHLIASQKKKNRKFWRSAVWIYITRILVDWRDSLFWCVQEELLKSNEQKQRDSQCLILPPQDLCKVNKGTKPSAVSAQFESTLHSSSVLSTATHVNSRSYTGKIGGK